MSYHSSFHEGMVPASFYQSYPIEDTASFIQNSYVALGYQQAQLAYPPTPTQVQ